MDNFSIKNIVDKEYISELNRIYFSHDTHECARIPCKNVIIAYITGSFVHYPRDALQHLLEFHLGKSYRSFRLVC